MTDKKSQNAFQRLGADGHDLRHIAVTVIPHLNPDGSEGFRLDVSGGDRFSVNVPTRFVFSSMDENWVFSEFQLAGRVHQGVAIFPDGEVQASFGENRRTVIIDNPCTTPGVFNCQLVLTPAQAARSDSSGSSNNSSGSIIIENGDGEH